MEQYSKRDAQALGNHYIRHMTAMTREKLTMKSDIAAKLAWRDLEIDRLNAELSNREDTAKAPQKQEVVAYLHNDGYWTAAETDAGRQLNERLMLAGSPKLGVYLHPPIMREPQGEKIETPEIHWVVGGYAVAGRPTDHDVREYLSRVPTAVGCQCEACRKFYHKDEASEYTTAALQPHSSPNQFLQTTVPTMDDAIAAGNGTLHGAIDYWQKRALDAESLVVKLQKKKGN